VYCVARNSVVPDEPQVAHGTERVKRKYGIVLVRNSGVPVEL
jgi:hypothetical protein